MNSRIREVAGGLVVLMSALPARATPHLPRADDPVIGGHALAPYWAAARVGRADIVMMGDSNQVYGGHGWDHGWGRAASARFSMYATGVLHPGENRGNGGQTGYLYNIQNLGGTNSPFFFDGAPPELDGFMNQPAWSTSYVYLPSENSVIGNWGSGMGASVDCPIDVNAALRFHYTYATFPSGNPGDPPSFRPAIRNNFTPYQVFAEGPWVDCQTGSYGVMSGVLDLPAGARHTALNFRYARFGPETIISGPFLMYYLRVENPARAVGSSQQTFWAAGGRSTRYMVERMNAMSDPALRLYFSKVRELQGPAGVRRAVLVRICQGLNDRNEALPSLGPGMFVPGDSPAAFADNTQAAIDRVRGVWAAAGWPAEELFFLITPSHPVSMPDDPELVGYRDAAEALAALNPRTAVVRLDRLTNADEMLMKNWYQSGGVDRNHLTVDGFETLAARELEALLATGCATDFNADGEQDFSDIEAFLALYAAGDWRADMNRDTEIDFTDIEFFLGLYIAGC